MNQTPRPSGILPKSALALKEKGETINRITEGHKLDRQGLLETVPKTLSLQSLGTGQEDAPGTALDRDNLDSSHPLGWE